MAGKVINLRQARKARERQAARDKADENAARHGLPLARRKAEEDEKSRARRLLDGHELEDGGGDSETE